MGRPVDPELEAEARTWIEAVLQRDLGEGTFQDVLKDGTALCECVAFPTRARALARRRTRVLTRCTRVLTRTRCVARAPSRVDAG